MTKSLSDFTASSIDGTDVQLSEFIGKVVLVVNVASYCGYTKQYTELEQIFRTYGDRGLVVLGFPSNNFGAQEPGTDKEIKEFCTSNYDVTFPLFSKVDVKGASKHALFSWLTSGGGTEHLEGDIAWNFEKFLIDRHGKLVMRFGTKVEPMFPEFIAQLESMLSE